MAINYSKFLSSGSTGTKKASKINYSKFVPKDYTPVEIAKSVTNIPQQSNIKTVKLPSGMGVYKTDISDKNKLIKTERTNYGGLPTKSGYERADITPVSLGGVNADPANIEYEKYSNWEMFKDKFYKMLGKSYVPQTATDKYLMKEVLPKYKNGEISLDQARVMAISRFRTNQMGVKQGTAANFLPAVGETLKKAGKATTDFLIGAEKKFGETLGTAVSVVDPEVRKSRQYVLDQAQEQFDLYMALAKKETDPNKKKMYLEAAKKSADTSGLDVFNNPEYQKTAKQIFGEGAEVFLDIATAGQYSKAGLVGKEAMKFGLDKGGKQVVKTLFKQGVKPAIKQLVKTSAPTVAKPVLEASKQTFKQGAKTLGKAALTQGAPLGAVYGLTGAIRENMGTKDTLKSIGTGAAIGTALQVGLGVAGKVITKVISVKNTKKIVKKVAKFTDVVDENGVKVLAKVDQAKKGKVIITVDKNLEPELAKQVDELIEAQKKAGEMKTITEDDIIKNELKKQEKLIIEKKTKPQIAPDGVKKEKVVEDITKEEILDSVNPTGGVFTEYTPEKRATAKLADNITTLDKTSNINPDETITIYRGAPKNQKEIVAGDFITTNKQLAKDYAGNGNVISKKVKVSDILDDIKEPLGEEYIYRPKPSKSTLFTKKLNRAIIKGGDKESAIVGITNFAGKRNKQILKLVESGKTKEALALGRKTIQDTFSDMPDVKITKLGDTEGGFFPTAPKTIKELKAGQEPSFDMRMTYPKSKRKEVLARLSYISDKNGFDQDNVLHSVVTNKSNPKAEPGTVFNFGKKLTNNEKKELIGIAAKNGLMGHTLTSDGEGIRFINVSKWGGDKNAFFDNVDKFIDSLSNNKKYNIPSVRNMNVENIILGRDNYEKYAKRYKVQNLGRGKEGNKTTGRGPGRKRDGRGDSNISTSKSKKVKLPSKSEPRYEPIEKPVVLPKKVDNRYKAKVEDIGAVPKTSKKIMEKVKEQDLVSEFGDLPEVDTRHIKDEARKINEIIGNGNQDDLVKISLGDNSLADKYNISPTSAFVAVKNQAFKDGNIDLLRALATDPNGVPVQSKIWGQNIKMLDEGIENDPFRQMRKGVSNREKLVEKKTGKTMDKIYKETKDEIKKVIEKTKPKLDEWTTFINEIRC